MYSIYNSFKLVTPATGVQLLKLGNFGHMVKIHELYVHNDVTRFGYNWHSRSSEEDSNRRRATHMARSKHTDRRQPIAIYHLNVSGNLINSFFYMPLSEVIK